MKRGRGCTPLFISSGSASVVLGWVNLIQSSVLKDQVRGWNTTTAWPRLWVLLTRNQSVSGVQTAYGSDKQCRGGASWIAVIFIKTFIGDANKLRRPYQGQQKCPSLLWGTKLMLALVGNCEESFGLCGFDARLGLHSRCRASPCAPRGRRDSCRLALRSLEVPLKASCVTPKERTATANCFARPRRWIAQQACRECKFSVLLHFVLAMFSFVL